MKTKILSLLAVGSLLALAAWMVHEPNPSQADEVPEKYRKTVEKGLEYLAKSQFKDGHWEGDGGQHPVAMTGLVGLALLMEMDDVSYRVGRGREREPKYSANILRATHWLLDNSHPSRDGLIFSNHASETARYMQGHGLATLFLAGVCKVESEPIRRKKLTDVLTRAVQYIAKAQSTQGGWYHTSKVEGHNFDTISATVIQIQALQAAEIAGIPVPTQAIDDAQEYLKKASEKDEAKPAQNRGRPADIAAVLAGRITSGGYGRALPEMPKDELRDKWFKYCEAEIPVGNRLKFGRDELAHYYFAQAVFYRGSYTWSTYRTAMFDHLRSSQNKDGGWPAGDGISVGPVYATAVWCTILQLDKRSHPSTAPTREITTITREVETWPRLRLATKSVGDSDA